MSADLPVSLPLTQEFLPLLLENLHDYALFITDIDGRALTWMPGVRNLLGFEENEFIGLSAEAIFTPEDRLQGAPAIEKQTAMAQGRAEDQRWHLRKDGSRFWANGQMIALRNENGELRGFAKIMRDDTERHEMERALEHSKARLENTLESITDAFYALDSNWNFTYLNPQAEKILLRTQADLLGKNIWVEFPAALGTAFEENYHKTAREQVATAFETFFAPLDGWFELRAYPANDGISVYFHNINERKVAEAALLERARLAELGAEVGRALTQDGTLGDMLHRCCTAMVEHLDAAFARIWTLDEAGSTLELQASAGLYTHLDGPHSRVPLGKFKIGQIAQQRRPHLTNEVIGDPQVSNQDWARSEGMVSFAGYPLVVEDRLIGVAAIFARQSLSQTTLQALASLANSTALGIEHKRGETERAQLLQREQNARRHAETTNRIKDEFLSTLSHELRTPLQAILGWTHLLRSGQLEKSDEERALETIERNARVQVQLVEDLLDVSRIITGKLRLEVQQVTLSQVVEAAVEAVRPAANAKNIRLQILLDPEAGPVAGDANRLQQVVWNLLTNAVKFTPKNGRVQIRLEQVNSHLEIIVSDSGIGIKPEFLPHIFDLFRQADQTNTRGHGGLGLGLSIVHHLVELHGGTIEAQSAGENLGSTFVVKLPRMALYDHRGEEKAHPTAQSSGGLEVAFDCPPQLQNLRVLLVDDEIDARELLCTVLERCGCQVTTAGSAAQALELFKNNPPAVLVSDIGMPGENGYALIRQIREWEYGQGGRVPAIALTAYARVEDRVQALRAGFQVHVPKPIEPVELLAVVASLV